MDAYFHRTSWACFVDEGSEAQKGRAASCFFPLELPHQLSLWGRTVFHNQGPSTPEEGSAKGFEEQPKRGQGRLLVILDA